MNFKQLEYILQIAVTRNVTKAAEKLFISQSALNQQLLNLEKELGTPLFIRSRGNWYLTKAGEIYVQNAKKCLDVKRQTYAQIYDITEKQNSTLTIGLTPGRGITMFTSIYPKLHALHPNLFINPVEMNVRNMQTEIENGTLDIGFMTLSKDQRNNDNYVVLGEEEMVLIIPADHPLGKADDTVSKTWKTIDLSLLKEESFILMYSRSTSREICDGIFKLSGFTPKILLETSNTNSIVKMVRSMPCCALLPEYYVINDPEGISCFRITTPKSWQLAISYRRDSYLSLAARSFIHLASEYWNEHLFLKKKDCN